MHPHSQPSPHILTSRLLVNSLNEHFKKFPSLTTLAVIDCFADGDDAAKHLSECRTLEDLEFGECELRNDFWCSDATIKHFSNCSQLRRLIFHSSIFRDPSVKAFTDASASELAKCAHLE